MNAPGIEVLLEMLTETEKALEQELARRVEDRNGFEAERKRFQDSLTALSAGHAKVMAAMQERAIGAEQKAAGLAEKCAELRNEVAVAKAETAEVRKKAEAECLEVEVTSRDVAGDIRGLEIRKRKP